MSFAAEHAELFSAISLESLFPAGMFDGSGTAGSGSALQVLRIIEELIKEETSYNALLSRYSLLQTFPRPDTGEQHSPREKERRSENPGVFFRGYCSAIMPQWYDKFLGALSDSELEVFLKNYLFAHELWGHPQGIALLVRTMMEQCIHLATPVHVDKLRGHSRPIPAHLHSLLGSQDQYSLLGRDLVLGSHFNSRPDHYRVTIGPISMPSLEKLQQGGWAEGTQATRRLHDLVGFASPFYFQSTVVILLETVGCVLGRVALGKDRLGTVTAEATEDLDVLVGVN